MSTDALFIFVAFIVEIIVIIALTKFSTALHAAVAKLEENIERDREQLNRLEATVKRMEAATRIVATNLASSVSRADATEGPDGAAADAALRTADTAERITARQDRAKQEDQGGS